MFKGKYGYCAPEQLEGARDRSPHRRLLPRHRAVGVPDRRAPLRRRHRRRRPSTRSARGRSSRRARCAPRSRRSSTRSRCGRCRAIRTALPDRARHVRGAGSLPARAATTGPPARAWAAGSRRSSGPSGRRLKKAISQGGEIEATLDRLFALNAIKPASGEATGAQTGSSGGQGAKAQPRALWSTSLGSHPSGNRRSASGRTSIPRRGAPRRADGRRRPPAGPVVTSLRGGRSPRPLSVVSAPRRRASRCRSRSGSSCCSPALGGASRRSCCAASVRSPRRRRHRRRAPPRRLEIRSQPPGAHVFVDGSPSGLRDAPRRYGPVGRHHRAASGWTSRGYRAGHRRR